MDFVLGFLTQTIFTVGIIFLFGWIISLLRRGFCSLTGKAGPKILLATGIIGTPIHELSHAAMCLLFGHKIVEIKLYTPKSNDGSLGYVNHTYRKKNIYHQIGNFFIGVAPVVLGGIVVVLLLALLLPDAFHSVSRDISALKSSSIDSLPIADFLGMIWTAICEIFSTDSLSSWQGWVFIILALMISTHMEMSAPDIKGSLKGLAFLLVIMLLVDGAMYLIFPGAFYAITGASVSFGFSLAAILSISSLFLLLLVIIAAIIRGIINIFSK